MELTTFLLKKGIVKPGFTDMIITRDDGQKFSLLELLYEYSEQKQVELLHWIGLFGKSEIQEFVNGEIADQELLDLFRGSEV